MCSTNNAGFRILKLPLYPSLTPFHLSDPGQVLNLSNGLFPHWKNGFMRVEYIFFLSHVLLLIDI